jgi:hypothetical protein
MRKVHQTIMAWVGAVLLVFIIAAFLVGPVFRGQPRLQSTLWLLLGAAGVSLVVSTVLLLVPWRVQPPSQPDGDRQAAGDRPATLRSMSCPLCGTGMERGAVIVRGRSGFWYRLILPAAAAVTDVWFVPLSEAEEAAAETDANAFGAMSHKLQEEGVLICEGMNACSAFRCSGCETVAIVSEPAERPGPTSEPARPAETSEGENLGTTPEQSPPSTR